MYATTTINDFLPVTAVTSLFLRLDGLDLNNYYDTVMDKVAWLMSVGACYCLKLKTEPKQTLIKS